MDYKLKSGQRKWLEFFVSCAECRSQWCGVGEFSLATNVLVFNSYTDEQKINLNSMISYYMNRVDEYQKSELMSTSLILLPQHQK